MKEQAPVAAVYDRRKSCNFAIESAVIDRRYSRLTAVYRGIKLP
jgi:hypothetical protein